METTIAPSGADYNAIFGDGLRGGGISDRQRDRLVREEHQRLHRQGWTPATVCNLHPFPLTVNLGDLGILTVPAAAAGLPGKLEIERYRISMRDLGDGNFTPVSVLPTELAKEFMREYGATGGVWWFAGTGEPKPEDVAEAKARQLGWWRQQYQQAVDNWSRYHQHKMITDRQRDAARALFTASEIAQLPEWVTVTRAQADRRDCPMCGESIRVTARICHFCRSDMNTSEPPIQGSPAKRQRSDRPAVAPTDLS
ncbi:MAG: hypothetical protein ACRD1M_16660 [Terriglobales bacterium]